MNIHRSTPITIARYGRSRNKTQDFEELSSIRSAEPSQSFSPNLGSPSPPETPNLSHCVSCIGKYLLLEPLEGDHVFRAVHLHSGEELVCKVFEISCYQESLAPCFCLSAHSNINQITEILLGETKAYVFFERSYGDMHSFVRTCKKLREEEAARLFYQIASAVAHCHDGGLVLRDLKLRKFIFKDEERSKLFNGTRLLPQESLLQRHLPEQDEVIINQTPFDQECLKHTIFITAHFFLYYRLCPVSGPIKIRLAYDSFHYLIVIIPMKFLLCFSPFFVCMFGWH